MPSDLKKNVAHKKPILKQLSMHGVAVFVAVFLFVVVFNVFVDPEKKF